MYDINSILDILFLENTEWEQKETKPELFQYNNYMYFLHIYGVDEFKFKLNKDYKILKCKNDILLDKVLKIIKKIENKYDKQSASVYFVKLNPQKYPLRQYYHFEEYSNKISECWIPIVYNDDVSFCLNDQVIKPTLEKEIVVEKEDFMALYNFGKEDTIYLIIDLLSN